MNTLERVVALDPARLTRVWTVCRTLSVPLSPDELAELALLCPEFGPVFKKELRHDS